jgi:hypothetical protein
MLVKLIMGFKKSSYLFFKSSKSRFNAKFTLFGRDSFTETTWLRVFDLYLSPMPESYKLRKEKSFY